MSASSNQVRIGPKTKIALAEANETIRHVARNSQWGDCFWGLGWSPQPPEERGPVGGALSARKFCIFLQK